MARSWGGKDKRLIEYIVPNSLENCIIQLKSISEKRQSGTNTTIDLAKENDLQHFAITRSFYGFRGTPYGYKFIYLKIQTSGNLEALTTHSTKITMVAQVAQKTFIVNGLIFIFLVWYGSRRLMPTSLSITLILFCLLLGFTAYLFLYRPWSLGKVYSMELVNQVRDCFTETNPDI